MTRARTPFSDTEHVIVNNVPPTLSLAGNTTVTVGSPYVLTINRTDPGTDTVSTISINWGDGDTQTLSPFTLVQTATVSHYYASTNATGSPYTISIASVSDEDGNYTSSMPSKIITVHNSAPLVTISGRPNGQSRLALYLDALGDK